jgi:hypothetical protein
VKKGELADESLDQASGGFIGSRFLPADPKNDVTIAEERTLRYPT